LELRFEDLGFSFPLTEGDWIESDSTLGVAEVEGVGEVDEENRKERRERLGDESGRSGVEFEPI